MTPKQRARVHAKLCYAHGNLEGIALSMYGCRSRDAYKQSRINAIKEVDKIKGLLNTAQRARIKTLVDDLKAGRSAPKIQVTIRKVKNYVWECAQNV